MGKVSIKILGGGQEVGRSAILLEIGSKRLLLDYGVMLEENAPQFPLSYPPKLIDAIVLTHAHLDHSGALPMLYISTSKPLYTTEMTLSLTEVLIRDFIKISGYYLPYEFKDFKEMVKNAIPIKANEETHLGDVSLRFNNAGHIPGSLSVSISSGDINVLYTGDFNMVETCLLPPARVEVKDADVIIIEGTYAAFNHPRRDHVEKEFVTNVTEVVENNGKVLIPAFAVGRAQEILCVLTKYNFNHTIYLDGMARTVTEILLKNPSFLRDPALFKKTYKKTTIVKGWEDRRNAVKQPCAIISPAGMLKGGASVYYLRRLNKKGKNAIFFVSYQSKGTPGREILEEGAFTDGRKPVKVKARVKWFDFSSHCGKRELEQVLKNADSSTKVIIVHSEKETGELFKRFCERELGLEAYFPKNGDELTLSIK